MSVNRQWLLVRRPQGMMSLDDFKYQETPFTPPELKPGDILVRNTFFSLVPAQRTWMNADSAYFPPMQLGKPVVSPAVAEVVASAINISGYNKGIRLHTPDPGEHQAEIMKSVGYSDEEIADLRKKGVI